MRAAMLLLLMSVSRFCVAGLREMFYYNRRSPLTLSINSPIAVWNKNGAD